MKFNVKIMAEITIFAAIAFVLDFLQSVIWGVTPLFPNGGSIGIALLPIMIIGIRRGAIGGLLCGLIAGLFTLLVPFVAISDTWYKVFLQVGLDYVFPTVFCGLFTGLLANLINQNKTKKYNLTIIILACFMGGMGKYLSHFLAGIIFWQNFEFGSPWLYSLIYNGTYSIPCAIICTLIVTLIYLKQPKIVLGDEK